MFFDIFAAMRILLTFFLLCPSLLFSQNYFAAHFGAQLGLSLNIGSHVNSIGIRAQGYYSESFFQVNGGTHFTFYTRAYGDRRKFIENRSVLGLVLMGGKQEMPIDFMFDGLNHQRAYNLAIGYNYIFYRDNAGTSQNSGAFALHIKQFSIYHENDFFAGLSGDRFRTAHFFVSYRSDFYRVGAGINLWTGETAGARRDNTVSKKTPNGFKILEDLPFGKTSHGLLYASFQGALPYGQFVSMRLGLDSEHVRHAIQNRLIHDLAFIPGLSKRTKRSTPHYPRLDENGCPVFTRDGVRKNRIYLQFGSNNDWAN